MSRLMQVLREHPEQVNAVVALLALGVSFLSILLTVIALYLQRQHNYKSLTPICSIPIGDYENEIAVYLKNTGIGPMIIESLRVTDGTSEKNDVISWMPNLPAGISWNTFYTKADGACVPAGSKLILLQLSGDPSNDTFASARDQCRKVLQELKVSVTYKDIYERSMPKSERTLSWFGRHVD